MERRENWTWKLFSWLNVWRQARKTFIWCAAMVYFPHSMISTTFNFVIFFSLQPNLVHFDKVFFSISQQYKRKKLLRIFFRHFLAKTKKTNVRICFHFSHFLLSLLVFVLEEIKTKTNEKNEGSQKSQN